jgi:hypothetical protein
MSRNNRWSLTAWARTIVNPISRLTSASAGGAPSYEYLSNKVAHRDDLSSFHFAPFICSAAVAVKRKSHFRPRLRALGL